ncbi:MAG: hypothetical protein QOF60_3235 [Actinomycetota bacterium]|nr:hypothetical protein [Actinomycetota bacterium]
MEEEDDRPKVEAPKRAGSLRRKSAGGALLAAAMVGLQEALEGPKEQPVEIEAGSSGNNPDDPLAVDLDPEDPSLSVAVVRPWLQKP